MRDQQSGPTPGAPKSTWVVLCPDADGTPRSEYVEGTELVNDQAAGVLRILDGGRVVREYTAGAWSTFCEWVNESLNEMYEDGSWAEAFTATVGQGGVETPEPPATGSCETPGAA